MKEHVMIDIETLGSDSFSSVVSIGAVQFDIETGEYGSEFYVEVSPKSCENYGLHVSQSTIDWWNKTNPNELEKIYSRGEDLYVSLLHFKKWFIEIEINLLNESGLYVLGNSNRFDLGLLDNALKSTGLSVFWNFRNERDVRTLTWLYPKIRDLEPAAGMSHNALDDCKYQINYCYKIYNKIKRTYES